MLKYICTMYSVHAKSDISVCHLTLHRFATLHSRLRFHWTRFCTRQHGNQFDCIEGGILMWFNGGTIARSFNSNYNSRIIYECSFRSRSVNKSILLLNCDIFMELHWTLTNQFHKPCSLKTPFSKITTTTNAIKYDNFPACK